MTGDLRLIEPTFSEGCHTPAAWSDGWVAEVSEDGALALWWSLRASSEGLDRSHQADEGFAVWTAAVESLWWLMALEDGLRELCTPARWAQVLASSPQGDVLKGLRWLRHRHAHEVMVTASGGPTRDFFGRDRKPEEDYVFYISPSPRWKVLEDIHAPNDRQPKLRPYYAKHVGGRYVDAPIRECITWFGTVLDASGVAQPEKPEDPTVFG
ncbi:hypothetical protein [Rathayibacter sp. AY1A7]|uniref:hypothetical protein n=1 Tax=Rathayibacter sp. AY1A7 TaxID=2080524 RepID=UPI000CE7DC18|nr:hypothetical protein [Rathayibacter sp. AY1A7]PPF14227.1 hypothetical protein C5B95_16990 [Rathayibacter sp. AY1A7]